jgi:Lipase (class 3)
MSEFQNNLTQIYRVLYRLSVLTDLNFYYMTLDPTLFPNVPSDIELHSGFVIEHMKTAKQILAEVKRLMDEYSSTNVILVRLHCSKLLPIRTPNILSLVLLYP